MAKQKDTSKDITGQVGALIDDPEFLTGIVRGALQLVLEGEMTEFIGARAL